MMNEYESEVNGGGRFTASNLDRAACMLSACLAALDEANMTLPNALPNMPDGVELGAVYFGAADIVRAAIADLRKAARAF